MHKSVGTAADDYSWPHVTGWLACGKFCTRLHDWSCSVLFKYVDGLCWRPLPAVATHEYNLLHIIMLLYICCMWLGFISMLSSFFCIFAVANSILSRLVETRLEYRSPQGSACYQWWGKGTIGKICKHTGETNLSHQGNALYMWSVWDTVRLLNFVLE